MVNMLSLARVFRNRCFILIRNRFRAASSDEVIAPSSPTVVATKSNDVPPAANVAWNVVTTSRPANAKLTAATTFNSLKGFSNYFSTKIQKLAIKGLFKCEFCRESYLEECIDGDWPAFNNPTSLRTRYATQHKEAISTFPHKCKCGNCFPTMEKFEDHIARGPDGDGCPLNPGQRLNSLKAEKADVDNV